jgi:hypothetical protein
MTIRVWRAFSCNNSSSYRLVARFVDAGAATAAAADLTAVLAAYATMPVDADAMRRPMLLLARQYGFDWEDDGWGGDDDGPHVVVEGERVFVHHRYCLGLGPGIPAHLAERGGAVEPETWAALQMSVLFHAPQATPRFDEDFATLLAQPRDTTSHESPSFHAPWSAEACRGRVACFRDAGVVGLHFPVDPSEIAAVKAWLAAHGIDGATMLFDEHADAELFATLATARCTSCNGPLEYLDPRLHDIETRQLMCRPCGGFYELATFTHAHALIHGDG